MSTEHRRPTQKQIADRVGVSVTTVSRILNPEEISPGRWASPAIVEAIRQAATDMGYRRNTLAAALRTSRSRTIGVLVPNLQDYVVATIHGGIDEAARERGIIAILADTLDQPHLREDRVQAMLDYAVDGLIFADSHLDETYFDDLETTGVPFTLVHRRKDGHVSVTMNDEEAGGLVASHLISLGRTSAAVISGHKYMSTGVDRTRGFTQRFAEAGLRPPAELDTGIDVYAGREATSILLASSRPFDSIFAVTDDAAIGALSVLRERGVRVPDDVAVVGHNDTPVALASDLTSIHAPNWVIGRRAFGLLLDKLEGRPAESEVIPASLVVRGSTDPTFRSGAESAL